MFFLIFTQANTQTKYGKLRACSHPAPSGKLPLCLSIYRLHCLEPYCGFIIFLQHYKLTKV